MALSEKERQQMDEGIILPLMEQFYTLQGEGFHTGKAAYFIRLGGCDIGCHWCDTKLSWNPDLFPPVPAATIVKKALEAGTKDLVITGGEPLMYNLTLLTSLLKQEGFTLYLETSGAHPLRGTFDWICLSPKKDKPPLPDIFGQADELKVIIETEEDIAWAEKNAGKVREGCHLFLQPEWSRHREILPTIIEYIKKHPRWRVSLQTHKFMRIP
jgi:organic radical activating enzyme